MISSATKFWFLLLDSATGQPHKGTMADFVKQIHQFQAGDWTTIKSICLVYELAPLTELVGECGQTKITKAKGTKRAPWHWDEVHQRAFPKIDYWDTLYLNIFIFQHWFESDVIRVKLSILLPPKP